jgi:hypothetical protein
MRSETMMYLGSIENLTEFPESSKEQREAHATVSRRFTPQRVASTGFLVGPTSGHYQP